MSNLIDWFEIPARDFNRAVSFYQNILSATLRVEHGGKMAIFPYTNDEHAVGGAVFHDEEGRGTGSGTIVYLNGGDDLGNILAKVEQNGGKIAMPKTSIGPNGFIAHFIDTEGNRVGLHSVN
jgi:uncharacterized protein